MASQKQQKRQGKWREIVLILGVILFLRTFIVEAFLIPTSSMERTLMAWDLVIVSKLHYGPRLPMVPLVIPFIHNKIPFTSIPSYLDWIVFPYKRLPGFKAIQRGDILVFNYPADDVMPNDPALGPVYIPSLKENYVKRCVAIAGDTLQVRDGEVYINGKPGFRPRYQQDRYLLGLRNGPITYRMLEPFGFRLPKSSNVNWYLHTDRSALLFMPALIAQQLRAHYASEIDTLYRVIEPDSQRHPQIYPQAPETFPWNLDQWGPFYLPRKGDSIALSPKNLLLYRRLIEGYEHHKVEAIGGKVYVDGVPRSYYTFEQNYYFVMGDNRYNSLDGRFWGPVPEDHVVGKPLGVLISIENFRPRWDRFLRAMQ